MCPQCWIPVLEGLLPEPHNKVILDLAFDLATWHTYAKLRKHTEYTIRSLRSQTKELGQQLRHFANKTCSEYKTKRLPSEEAARIRRCAGKAKKQSKKTGSGGPATEGSPDMKHFSLMTYKIHALGDYADHIEQFGPTDCFTTQYVHHPLFRFRSINSQDWSQGECEHRRVKCFYKRTNKGVSFPHQIAKQERMQRHYRKFVEAYMGKGRSGSQPSGGHEGRLSRRHYSMSKRSHGNLGLYKWTLGEHANDPAVKVCTPTHSYDTSNQPTHQDFIPKLTDHLLARILHHQYDPELPTFTDDDCDRVYIAGNCLQQRRTMSIYYTTYDLRRGVDKINTRGRPYVMALSHGDPSHPYIYARVLGIYRVKVLHPTMTELMDMDVLWVRWLNINQKHRAGWKAKRLYRVQFIPNHKEGAFGFLDPEDVIRGVHLIPGFNHGYMEDSLDGSISMWDYAPADNWQYYYVNQ